MNEVSLGWPKAYDNAGQLLSLNRQLRNTTQTHSYDSFGNIISSTGSVDQPYTYTGREYDTETGLYYYRARYYDARMGRFLQEDPLFTTNLYVYVANNPINFIDPLGLKGEKLTDNQKKLREILEMENRLGTWRTLAEYSFGSALGVLVRLKNGQMADLQYTLDIGWASKTGPLTPAVFTVGWEILRRIPYSPIEWSQGLSDKVNREGWKAGWQFYPFSQVKIRDIIDPESLEELF